MTHFENLVEALARVLCTPSNLSYFEGLVNCSFEDWKRVNYNGHGRPFEIRQEFIFYILKLRHGNNFVRGLDEDIELMKNDDKCTFKLTLKGPPFTPKSPES